MAKQIKKRRLLKRFARSCLGWVLAWGLDWISGKIRKFFLKDPMFVDLAKFYGDKYGVDPALILAVMKSENPELNPNLVTAETFKDREGKTVSTFSYGLMQVLWETAKVLGHTGTEADLKKPEVNINLGAKYLGDLQKRYPVIQDAVSAYNKGRPQRIGKGKYKNQFYVDTVMRNYRRFQARQFEGQMLTGLVIGLLSYYLWTGLLGE
jgi:soluble lytic murein transglycosylase-like protein